MIDYEKLRQDLADECYGAFFGGGFGGALMEAFDIERCSDEELLRYAEEQGVDLSRYER